MADYDLSRPAPDRTGYDAGSGAGGLGFILAGAVIVLVVLFAIFGGAAVPTEGTASDPSAPAAIAAEPDPAPVTGE